MPDRAASAVLTIDVERCAGDLAIVRCHGRLVAGATHLLYAAVDDLVPETQRIVLDLSDLWHTDSMGLGVLVRIYVSAKYAGCSVELLNLSQQIRQLLGTTNMLEVFPVITGDRVEFG